MTGKRGQYKVISMVTILLLLAIVTVSCTFSIPIEMGYDKDLLLDFDPENRICTISFEDGGEWKNTFIYYTYDDESPDSAMAILYDGPFKALPGMTVRAVYFNINPVYSRSKVYAWKLTKTGREAVNE